MKEIELLYHENEGHFQATPLGHYLFYYSFIHYLLIIVN